MSEWVLVPKEATPQMMTALFTGSGGWDKAVDARPPIPDEVLQNMVGRMLDKVVEEMGGPPMDTQVGYICASLEGLLRAALELPPTSKIENEQTLSMQERINQLENEVEALTIAGGEIEFELKVEREKNDLPPLKRRKATVKFK